MESLALTETNRRFGVYYRSLKTSPQAGVFQGGRLINCPLMTPTITQDRAAWDAGFAAGESGQTVTACPYPAAAADSLAWYSGFIEGKAKRSYPPAG